METVVLLVILSGAVSGDSHRDRRILLHSDVDIAQAIQSLKGDSVQMKSDLIHLQGTVAQLQSQNSQLNGSVSQLQSQNSQLQSHNSQLQGTVSQLQSQNSQLNGSVSQLQRQNSQLQSQNSQLQGTVAQIQSQNSQLQGTVSHMQSINKGTGSTYVRWGRTTCPANGTTVAYSGYMGGGRYNETGAAVNRLCLTADPIWEHYNDSMDSQGRVYGVEYELWNQRDDGGAAFFGTNMYNQDAPCAVCHSPRSAAMMIPGRNKCLPGWTMEYSGYLVSSADHHVAATEYICLDRRPESLPGGGRDDNENVLYLVEGVCGGSLECPPYVNGRELTCVVCTK